MDRRGVLVAAALGLAMAISVGALVSTSDNRNLDLDAIPEGVTAMTFGTTPAFVVKSGDRVEVFLTGVPHLPGEYALWWCPGERLFAAPTHGELFNVDGEVVGGPARAGLDRLAARVVNGRLVVDTDQLIPGRTRPASPASDVMPDSGPWDSGPGSFCAGAVRSGGG